MATKKKTKIDPPKKKKAVIVAHGESPEFTEEFNRTRNQYQSFYPGGVEFVTAQDYNSLRNAFGKVDSDEDLILMDHHSRNKLFGTPLTGDNNSISSLFQDLQDRGYQGNCYMGICNGELVAQDIQNTGVNIPMYATPFDKKWVGANPGNKGSFEDFFFGVEGGKGDNFGKGKVPTYGEDYTKVDVRGQELQNRRLFGEHPTNIKPLEMKKGGKIKKANLGEIVKKLGGVEGIANTTGQLLGGLQLLKQDQNNLSQAEQLLQLSKLVGEAASLQPDLPTRRYVRPEDNPINPGELYPSYGTDSGLLAKNGKTLPSYNFGGNAGQLLGSFIGGGRGQGSGAGNLGSTIGGVAGSIIPGVGTVLGSAVGGLIGGIVGGRQQKKLEQKQNQAFKHLNMAALQQGFGGLQNQYSAFMKNGGKMAMGGELQLLDNGSTDVIAHNPYLPSTGETIMFNGPSHEQGGIPIAFGRNKVEVEGGEPAVKLRDGGSSESLHIFGDMKIPSYGVTELNDPRAKNKKFKNYIKLLSEEEDKANKRLNKGTELLNEPIQTAFDKLRFASGKALLEGSDMKLRDIAQKKQIAASIQDAILQTAKEMNLDSGELAKGNIKKAKKGAKVKAQNGIPLAINNPEFHSFKDRGIGSTTIPVDLTSIIPQQLAAQSPLGPFAYENNQEPRADGFAESVSPLEDRNNLDWMAVANSILPFVRPSNQMPLDPNQLSGEMFALATNQLEPVQAQTYQPMLESASTISLQDQMNANQADFNAILRQTRNNPTAQSILAAQKYKANSAILGEQTRINQERQIGTQNRNRQLLNDATLKNLAILDQQYERQARAKSNTKATSHAALSSIADKIAKNKLENRTLGVYENLYNYRFGPNGQAINMNPLFNPNIPQASGTTLEEVDEKGNNITNTSEHQVTYDKMGNPTGSRKKNKTTTKSGKNGYVVKAWKNL